MTACPASVGLFLGRLSSAGLRILGERHGWSRGRLKISAKVKLGRVRQEKVPRVVRSAAPSTFHQPHAALSIEPQQRRGYLPRYEPDAS